MSGYLDDLSEEQEECLKEFKKLADPEIEKWYQEHPEFIPTPLELKMKDDDTFKLKYLRARKFRVKEAVQQYIETVKWRKTFHGIGVEAVTEQMIENELKSGKSFFYKYDKEGRSVLYVKPKLHDPHAASIEEVEKSIVWHAEMGIKLLKNGVETGAVVYDMEGFSLSNMDYKLMQAEIHILERYYPESMGVTLVINAPFVFWGCWQIIKPWIDPVAREKVLFIKKEELIKYIDKESLLQEYGGDDPYTFSYVPVAEREGTDFVATWEMDWAKHDESASNSSYNDYLSDDDDNNNGSGSGNGNGNGGNEEGNREVKKRVYRRPIMQVESSVNNCSACNTGFGWITRKHHCRACGKIFCSTCCPQNQLIVLPASMKYTNPERVCHSCFKLFGSNNNNDT